MTEEITQESRDALADIVLDRFKRAYDHRRTHIVHQDITVDELMRRSSAQYRREYTTSDAQQMTAAFGFCPTRYMGVVQQKTNATYNWKMDLVVTSLDTLFTVTPTPEPDIDSASRKRIRDAVRAELFERMANAGVVDPELLLDPTGKPNERIQGFLQEQAQQLKTVEQERIVSLARASAGKMQMHMRDVLLEGGFRQEYGHYTFDQILHGRGVMRFPYFQNVPTLQHKKTSGVKMINEVRPTFKHVRVQDFFPVDDSSSLQTNSGNTERTHFTKAELIKCLKNEDFFEDEILDILENYEYRNRNWLYSSDDDQQAPWWGLDEPIPVLIHEGYFSGRELSEYGITHIDNNELVSARVVVCGGRTISAVMAEYPDGPGRSYHQSPFVITGKGLYDAIGMGAMLWDTEQRVNRLMHIFEHNIDWAARPPLMRNPSAFDNAGAADVIAPGATYDVEEGYGAAGRIPEALRTMNTVSAQYHLIMTQVGALLRQADEDCGIPAFAYSSQDFGRSSLGEYTQRMSNALRTVKALAQNEDVYLIEPAFSEMFRQVMLEDDEITVGQDVNIVIRGMSGLLKEDIASQRQQAILPMILQSGQSGLVPESVVEYSVYKMLADAGYPVDSLGMSNPVIDNALAVAANAPSPAGVSDVIGGQVPTLDGRSGPIPMENVGMPAGVQTIE